MATVIKLPDSKQDWLLLLMNISVGVLLIFMLWSLFSFITVHGRLPYGSGEVINWILGLGQ